MGIFGRSIYETSRQDPRLRRMGAFMSAYSRPMNFGLEGLELRTRQDSGSPLIVERQGGGQFVVGTDANGQMKLSLLTAAGAGFQTQIGADGSTYSMTMGNGTQNFFNHSVSGTVLSYVRAEHSTTENLTSANRIHACTAGGIDLNASGFAEGQIDAGNWMILCDSGGNATASPIDITVSSPDTMNGSSDDVTISENYGGLLCVANDEGEWVTWKLQSARQESMGVVAGITLTQSNLTLTGGHYTILVVNNLGDVTITLPPATDHTGRIYNIKKTKANNTVTISPDGSDTIDGRSSLVFGNQNESYRIQASGSTWYIL